MKALALKLSISLALIFALLARADVAELKRLLVSAGFPALIIGALCIFALSVTTAVRWKIVLAEFRHPQLFYEVWRYTIIGMFFNQLLPSGIGGDGIRMWYARRAGLPLGVAVGTVIVDRILGLLGLLLLVIIGLPYLLSLRAAGLAAIVIAVSAVLLAFAIGIFFWIDRIMASTATLVRGRLAASFTRRPLVARLKHGLERTARDMRRLLGALPSGPATLLLSLVNQIVVGLVVLYLARSMSLSLSLAAAVFLFPPVLLLSMIPISLAGWGIREGAMVVIFSLAGLPADASLSISVLFGACLILSGLPGGLFWLLSRRGATGAHGHAP